MFKAFIPSSFSLLTFTIYLGCCEMEFFTFTNSLFLKKLNPVDWRSVFCWLRLKKKGCLTLSFFFSTMGLTVPNNTTWWTPNSPENLRTIFQVHSFIELYLTVTGFITPASAFRLLHLHLQAIMYNPIISSCASFLLPISQLRNFQLDLGLIYRCESSWYYLASFLNGLCFIFESLPELDRTKRIITPMGHGS